MTEEIKALHELITNVRLDLRELSTKMDGIKDLTRKVEEIRDIANKAFESTKVAHHRLDEIKIRTDTFDKHFDGEIRSINIRIDEDNEKRRQSQRWLIGTMITSAGLVIAVLTVILRITGF